METNRFAADYGQLPAAYFSLGRITNPAELLRGEALYRALRLCGIAEEENGERASDWELFCSACRATSMLVGHPMRENILRLLKACLPTEEKFDVSDCERLWRDAVAFLSTHAYAPADFLPREKTAWLSDTLELPSCLPPTVKPALLANLLLRDTDGELSAWRQRIRDTVARYARAGGDLAVLRLTRDFSFASPDPYHVGIALRSKRRSSSDEHMLTAQLLRELCEICAKTGMRLLVEADCDASLLSLLDYTERSVGLPSTCIAASDAALRDRLIERMGEAGHNTDLRLAVRLSDAPCAEERQLEWKKLLARYPAGRLCVISAADLRVIADVQAEIVNELGLLF